MNTVTINERITIYFLTSLIICFILIGLNFILIEKNLEKEKSSIYECGFKPINNKNSLFSVKFFIVCIIFLVFDLEIILLFPWSVSLKTLGIEGNLIFLIFLFLLTAGLFYEWVNGALLWE